MAKPYLTELSKLADTFEWAAGTDIDEIKQVVGATVSSPLRAVGSGGSLTVAHAIASLHQRLTGQLAAVATPLEARAEPLNAGVTTWLMSAGGGNGDILMAARAFIAREPRQLVVLCGRKDGPLVKLCRQHPFVKLLAYPLPSGKDGFLATNSLLGFTVLLTRAYYETFNRKDDWELATKSAMPLLSARSARVSEWRQLVAPLWKRSTILVLHGPATRIGAIDLESKFTEAALGNLQSVDYRNFAHGQHHWLAKRGEESAVLALVTDDDHLLAKRTLALLPSEIPQAQLRFRGPPDAAALGSLVATLHITGWVGVARGIDPGRPGVPEFGRKIYKLSPSLATRGRCPGALSERDAVATLRKTGLMPYGSSRRPGGAGPVS